MAISGIPTPTFPRSPAASSLEGPEYPPARTRESVQEEYHESNTNRGEVALPRSKWSMGVLNDPKAILVPGSVLLLAKDHNAPLSLPYAPARTSRSSLPPGMPIYPFPKRSEDDKKRTDDGKIILEPQPDDSGNDPLNWPALRRDLALLSLGFYCMIGGGVTTLLAAGFTDIAKEYHVKVEEVAPTTGFTMMGLALGSVFVSPTAVLFGKRPAYLASAILFILSSVWCALSPNFASLVVARILQGMAISPVECLPSATIADIFFLHERAFRIGIYTLLLIGGKNLIPLASAAIIGRLGWRWTFWIVCMVAALALCLLLLFVPETYWDRTPIPKSKMPKRPNYMHRLSSTKSVRHQQHPPITPITPAIPNIPHVESTASGIQQKLKEVHVNQVDSPPASIATLSIQPRYTPHTSSDVSLEQERDPEKGQLGKPPIPRMPSHMKSIYTHELRHSPNKSWAQRLKPFNGRLCNEKWIKVFVRPFILFSYPSVLWSSVIYACSIGWLIVISETMAMIYRDSKNYDFTAIQTGLVYISPFVGGVLGTGVAGKVSDIGVRFLAKRNGGLYEPEFRLLMVIPVAISTGIGLVGFGWSAEEKDHWMVPTAFFGIISFGCSLGSTTAIAFCVDSYRQYASEALVTLNFTKNIFHGFLFSLFVSHWVHDSGPKMVFIYIGIIQLIVILFTIPMYIFGKRCRMWTVRRNSMEKF